jgi:CoA:oxalate CoA-transferase
MTSPLSGLRVLDLSRVMSGPYCTSMLADLGAEVIKIEQPETGDESRFFGPYLNGESTYFMVLNRNKKSVTIDMKSDQGRAIIHDLARQSDIVVENFRPGVAARLGVDYDSLKEINPRLVYASISGFGQESPLRDIPAFDLVIQAMGGLMSLTGPKGGPATAVGESIADVATGMFAAFGIVAAIYEREKSGQGQHIDIAMLDSLLSMQLTGLARQLYFQDTPEPVGNRHPVTYPVDSFDTKTGQIVLVCFSDRAFTGLAELIGDASLAQHPDYSDNAARNRNEGTLRQMIQDWASGLVAQAAVDALIKAGIPAAPVWTLAQLTESQHVAERNLIGKGQHQTFGSVPVVGVPLKFSRSETMENPVIPKLGQHTEEVLCQMLGISADDLATLRAQKAI